MTPDRGGVDLYWLPLGAGGHFVRLNGRAYEAISARAHRRPARDLYHAALEIRLGPRRFVIEQAPAGRGRAEERGVIAVGPVGARWAGRFRVFRYEIRRWEGGRIPDIDEAVDSPRRLTADARDAQRLLDLAPAVPTPVWGRDELGAGEMWNSNSIVAWMVERSGVGADGVPPPAGGRAPGWGAGVKVARRGEPAGRRSD